MSQAPCEPGNRVLQKVGVALAAEITGKSEVQVRRWRRPKPSGTGGAISLEDATVLIAEAPKHGIKLTWNDFKPVIPADTS